VLPSLKIQYAKIVAPTGSPKITTATVAARGDVAMLSDDPPGAAPAELPAPGAEPAATKTGT
jgi:hypothetical protein